MSVWNAFFRVEQPFQVFKHVGISASNSYAGASRIFATVMEAINSRPGDEIHALVGGTFLKRGNEVFPISLKPRKPPFEKSYGSQSAAEVMAHRAKVGLVVQIPEPHSRPDYSAANKRVSANHLRDLHPEIVHVDDSPELVKLSEIVAPFMRRLREIDDTATVEYRDIDAYGGPKATVRFSDTYAFIRSTVPGVYAIDLPDDAPRARFMNSQVNKGRISYHVRTIDGCDVEPDTRELLTAYVDALAARQVAGMSR